MESESFEQQAAGLAHSWQLGTGQPGFTGTGYLQAAPDVDGLYLSVPLAASPVVSYPINFTTPGTYTLWLRGYPANAAGDSVHASLNGQVVGLSGFSPNAWTWTNQSLVNDTATITISQSGLYTLSLWMREDGLRLDRILLTTDTTYLPTGFGPAETARQDDQSSTQLTLLNQTIVYTYDRLYHLTQADYSGGDQYQYGYDPVGNRLEQIINGDTSTYTYDAANRISTVNGQAYSYDSNGNLLTTGVQTNTWDTANRLVSTSRDGNLLQPTYDGQDNRVAQVTGGLTTTFALDTGIGLAEVIYTSADNAYLHLPGAMMTESATGTVRYLLNDGLGSVRQAVDEGATVVSYKEFDPYGNPIGNGQSEIVNRYGYTGEWWEDEVGLLHLRARWYLPEDGVFLSRDVMEGEPPYVYVRGNPVNLVDPSGLISRKVIANSLGTSIVEAFSTVDGWGRAGLYHLLLDANKGDRVDALVVDFEAQTGPRFRYPFSYNEEVTANIDCRNDEIIMLYGRFGRERPQTFAGRRVWQSSLSEYLDFLEIYELRMEYGRIGHAPSWRYETVRRYHYYARNSGNFYDDFGNYTMLPDVVGRNASLQSISFQVGGGAEYLIDRHGQEYLGVAVVSGFGPLPIAVNYREGYLLHFNYSGVRYDSTLIKTPSALASHLSRWGWDVGLSLIAGVQLGTPLPAFQPDILWFSEGLDLGLSGSIGYVFGPRPNGPNRNLSWHWVDETSVGYDMASLSSPGYELTPENACDCQ